MNDPRIASQNEMEEESRAMTGGPGVVATKSQARGAVGGGFVGGIVGALIGLVVGLLAFDGTGTIITVVVGGVAGFVFGGVSGGIVRPMQKLDEDESDADT